MTDPTIDIRMARYNAKCQRQEIKKVDLMIAPQLGPWLKTACGVMRTEQRTYGICNLPKLPDPNPYVDYGDPIRYQVRLPKSMIKPLKESLKEWRQKLKANANTN